MSKVCHVFLTRFNLQSGGKEKEIRQSSGWLEKRFQLFEDYCFPSMLAQTRKDFFWLIYFDANTPEKYKTLVKGYQKKMPKLLPIWVSPGETVNVSEDVLSLSKETKSTHILTTRLDNDDGIHEDFISTLRKYADPCLHIKSPQVFNFNQGYIIANKKFYSYKDTSNPFSSLLESALKPKTIWGAQHVNIANLGELHQLETEPMWLQVVHEDNVRNRIKGKRVVKPLKDAFSLPEGLTVNTNLTGAYIENMTIGIARLFYETALRLTKKFLNRFC